MKFLIADDHELVREAIGRMLLQLDPEAECFEASDWSGLSERALPEADLDLAIVDLHMPGMRGADSITEVLKSNPGLPLVVLSGDESPQEMRSVLAAGALGFIPKREPAAVMKQVIALILSGGTYVPRQILEPLPVGTPPPGPGDLTVLSQLSPRQRDILRLVHLGQTNKMIARELGISDGTVKIHLSTIMRTLRAPNRAAAIAIYNGWTVSAERGSSRS